MAGAPQGVRSIHLTYAGLWDEVELTYRYCGDPRYRAQRSAMRGQTMVQKGALQFACSDHAQCKTFCFHEDWTVQPVEVAGATAECLYSGLRRGTPAQLFVGNLEALRATAGKVSSLTLMPMCDRASSNLAMLKHMGNEVENRLGETVGHRVLLWPDTCGIHLLHRAKLALKSIRSHTMRHYAIANLFKLGGERRKMIRKLEELVAERVVRVVGPPPANNQYTLNMLLDILYDWHAEHHKRKNGRCSQMLQDLRDLAEVVNGDMTDDVWRHWCWDAERSAPCCESQQETVERTTTACVNAFFACGDPVPAESRWTHLLPNMKRSLLRRLVHRAGLDCFSGDAVAEELVVAEVDGEATGEYIAKVNATRRSRTAQYYLDEKNMHELAVLTALMEATDNTLMYPLFGDPTPADMQTPSKLDRILDQRTSLLGHCMEKLVHLLKSWTAGGATRKPWALLDALGAPVQDEAFMRWSRSQILRLCSSIYRRYEVRFASWPYRLHALASEGYDRPERVSIANELLQEDDSMLDVYSRGIKALFPGVGELLSHKCRSTLAADFKAHTFATDSVERLNAELARGHSTRGPARSFVHMARESVLRQVAVSHRCRGGCSPLGAEALTKQAQKESVECQPLLPIANDGQRNVAAASAGHPALQLRSAGSSADD